MKKVFDVHCHIYPHKIAQKASDAIGSFYSMPMRNDGSVEQLLIQADKSNTDMMAVHSAATTPHQVASINRFISDTAAEHPDRFVGFGTLHPESDSLEADIEQLFALGLRGIKLHPDFQKFDLDSPSAKRMFSLVGDRLPFLVHMGDDRFSYSAPDRLKNVIREMPYLRIIAAHFGGWTMWKEGAAALAGTPGIYVDCSSSIFALSKDESVKIIRDFGADRVLYGSDYPMWNLDEELDRFENLDLSEEEKRLILWENAAKLLNL